LLPTAFEGIRKQHDQGKVTTRRQDEPSPMGDHNIIIDRQPVTGSHCEPFDAANSRRRGQAGQGRCRINTGNTWHAKQAPNEGNAWQRTGYRFQSADIVDAAVKPFCLWTDTDNRCPTQVIAAAGTMMLRNEFSLIESRDTAAAGRTSIAQSATMF
jgi:hypothetical protein